MIAPRRIAWIAAVVLAIPLLNAAPASAAGSARPVVISVRAVVPSTGATGTITGKNLAGAKAVYVGPVGGTTAAIMHSSATTLTVRFPHHSPGFWHVRVVTTAGTSAISAHDSTYYTAPADTTWQQSYRFNQKRGVVVAVSCPTAYFCAAADDARVSMFTDGQWQPPTLVAVDRKVTALTCASPTLCLAGFADGTVRKWTGGTWGNPAQVTKYAITDIACASATWCVAVDYEGRAVTDSAGHWGTPVPTGNGHTSDIACAADGNQRFCLAIGYYQIARFDGTNWRVDATAPGVRPEYASGVSCPSVTFCAVVAVDYGRYFATLDAGVWTEHTAPLSLSDVSCTAPSACVVAGAFTTTDPAVSTWNGTAFSTPVALSGAVDPYGDLVSCAAGSCGIGDRSGELVHGDGGTFGTFVNVLGADESPQDVSCGAATSCWTIGGFFVMPSDGSGQQQSIGPVSTTSVQEPTISCPSAQFCAALTPGRAFAIRSGGDWQSRPAPAALTGFEVFLSCTSATFCMAVDVPGHTSTWNGTAWADSGTVNGAGGLSCASATFCVAMTGGTPGSPSAWRKWDGTRWVPMAAPSITGPSSISCPSASVCVAAGDSFVSTWRSGTWTTPKELFGHKVLYVFVSCVSSTWCEAIGPYGQARSWNGSAWTDGVQLDIETKDGDRITHLACGAIHRCVATSPDLAFASAPLAG